MRTSSARLTSFSRRLQPATLVLLALLQRLPALRTLAEVQRFWPAAPLGQLMRASVTTVAALGTIDTLAGATSLAVNPVSPAVTRVGTAFTAAFITTGADSQAFSYTLTNLPPGLTVPGSATSGGVTKFNTTDQFGTGTITGIPTIVGTFNVGITAWEFTNATGLSKAFTYVINVAAATTAAPAITTQPQSQSTTAGKSITLTAAASGTPAPTFQWKKDAASIAGATSATLTLSNAQIADSGLYTVVATNSAGLALSNPATLTVLPPASFLSNLSVRAAMNTGQTLIVGFVVDGGAKPLLVRAAGPTLTSLNAGLTGVTDPRLSLFDGSIPAVLAGQNDNWSSTLATVFTARGAFGFNPGSNDAALQQAVSGAHTAQAVATDAGAILVEAYDAGPNDGRRLTNLSARFRVGTGDNILIAGFVVAGTGTKQLLVRAVGPKLADFGVTGILANPQFSVFDGTDPQHPVLVDSNDNWSSDLAATFGALGAFVLTNSAGLPTNDTASAAKVLTLQAGKPYTVQVSGVAATTGEALVEIYDIP